ncbi:MAG: ABC transporter permease subunit [Anaerolineales bacterium]|nr:ABC transporter permease subunit [Anaerolineales bacterium]
MDMKHLGTKRIRIKKSWLDWIPLLPFLFLCFAIMILPMFFMLKGSFTGSEGQFTLEHYAKMQASIYATSFKNSILLSGITAILGVIFGTIVGYFICQLKSKRAQELVTALCDVTSNFSGAPLAFAFIVILGSNGVLTLALQKYFDWQIYPGFSIYSFSGLILSYSYFQFPLMVLLIIPAIAGLKREWKEAAHGLGANTFQYWRYVGIPILSPAIAAGLLLLFANAFGAYATAYTLTEFRYPLVTLQLGFLMKGEVFRDPGAGDAMGILALMLMGISILFYQIASKQGSKWQQ